MSNRVVRFFILTILIASGIGATYLFWDIRTQSIATADRHGDLNARLDAVLASLAAVGTAQQAYVAPGQTSGAWMERVPPLMQRLYDESAALGGYVAASASASTLNAVREDLDSLMAADSRAREYLRVSQDLMAADVVFNDARDTIARMEGNLRAVRTMEAAQAREAASARDTQEAIILGTVAGLWLLGLLMLFRVPRTMAVEIAAPAQDAVGPSEMSTERAVEPALDLAVAPPIDLSRAAAVCSDLARITDGASLPALFARVAQVLDAPGVILWLGAGEQLFAVAAHGYGPKVLARVGPIRRAAENATAAAWRTAEIRTVSGEGANGAIVAPMIGPDGCRGVLAVEVRHGRESDPAARAVATMMAAQLTGLVAAWPAASTEPKPIAQVG